jgi:hypothetical protein
VGAKYPEAPDLVARTLQSERENFTLLKSLEIRFTRPPKVDFG